MYQQNVYKTSTNCINNLNKMYNVNLNKTKCIKNLNKMYKKHKQNVQKKQNV